MQTKKQNSDKKYRNKTKKITSNPTKKYVTQQTNWYINVKKTNILVVIRKKVYFQETILPNHWGQLWYWLYQYFNFQSSVWQSFLKPRRHKLTFLRKASYIYSIAFCNNNGGCHWWRLHFVFQVRTNLHYWSFSWPCIFCWHLYI